MVTRCNSYLWYVMENARLVLVREKRALATPLELGSHESVTPVSTATKSADGESVFLSTESIPPPFCPRTETFSPEHTDVFCQLYMI